MRIQVKQNQGKNIYKKERKEKKRRGRYRNTVNKDIALEQKTTKRDQIRHRKDMNNTKKTNKEKHTQKNDQNIREEEEKK